MDNPWITKMEQFTKFSAQERQKLQALSDERQKDYHAREDILTEGEHVEDCHVVLSGLAMRYKILPTGERQIMAFLVPGDLCDAEIFILKEMDHSVAAVSPTTTALISSKIMKEMLRSSGALGEALWWGTLTDLGVLRERIIDHGRRNAQVRMAHLIYELLVRYRVFGDAKDNSFDFPVTQEELGDATGMTPIHANRMLQKLRREGLITLENKRLTVTDTNGLKKLARFEANYLHLDRSHDESEGVSSRVGDLV